MPPWFAIVAVVVFCLALLFALFWAHLRYWQRRLFRPMQYQIEQEVAMPDGGAIMLRRICSPAADYDATPVLLIHGLAMNERNHDHAEQGSLARVLTSAGRDVWLLTLRSGHGRPSLFGPAQSAFKAMAEFDVPFAVRRVLELSNAAQLDIVAFSMGGMLIYASLGRGLEEKLVRRVVMIGAPARIRPLPLLSYASYLPVAFTPSVPVKLWARTIVAAPSVMSPLLRRLLYNPRNITREVERTILWNAWADIPGRLGADFVGWSARGGAITIDGNDVLEGLGRSGVPVCFFAGSRDWLAPLATVRAGYEAWGREVACEKHFVVLGRAQGAHEDYGHCDLSFGRHAREEVFEPAVHFLATGELLLPQPATNVASDRPPYEAHGLPA